MKSWNNYVSLTVACIILGLLITVALRAQSVINGGESASKNKVLIDLINNLEKENESLQNSIGSIRNEIDQIQKQDSSGQSNLLNLQGQINQLKLRAGLTEVSGPGIIVTLDDNNAGAEANKIKNPKYYNPEDYIVHDKNLLYLVNDLRDLGEAIAINNQRIVSTSDIRCVGTVIMVNSSRLAPPYQIQVIGDKDLLKSAVLNSDEYNIYLKGKDMPVTIEQINNLVLPAYYGSNTLKYTQPAKEEGI